MRPVLRGLCRYESLKGCTLDLCDIARMNDALDIDEENRARITEWANGNNGR